ncbi:radical SAM family heme chaperone HemW [uncultured Roseovarius sp.]|uniref:radical SAM family heme chaperone HemW n=1 Tax=uncultured Roseovarius sp. TaxID=293344 RepID=UPI0026191F3B|nr:radical SAM family heme chaperone HemW [uncultured Roseovarius sp.]
MAENWQIGGFGLYIHWPFCQAKCPYCDFNSHVARKIDQSAWQAAYLREIDRYADMLPGRVLSSVFFGGGTPSLMDPDVVAAVLDRVRRRWPTVNDLEVTLEANPGSVEAGRFQGYADGGVTRISMGIQALNDTDLRRLGRIHTVAEARQAFDIARKCFGRVSFDLIYARQDQSLTDWRQELQAALNMAVDHLSLYQLTIEDGTAFGDRYAAGKLRGLPENDLSADMYQVTQALCDAAGLPAYEVSNHARPGAESRHNRIYWRYGDYVGIGPGAHGRISKGGTRLATEAFSSPAKWLTEADHGTTEKPATVLSGPEQADEYLMMGLRVNDGIDRARYEVMAGEALSKVKIRELEGLGMITADPERIRVTDQGRMLLNAVIKEFLSGM